MSDKSIYAVFIDNQWGAVPRIDWRILFEKCPDATLFQSWEWIDAWATTCAMDDADELHIVSVRTIVDRQLVAIAPMYRAGHRLRFLGGNHNDYQLFLVNPEHPVVYSILFEALTGIGQVDKIALREVPSKSMMMQAIQAHDLQLIERDEVTCPAVTLNGNRNVYSLWSKKSVQRKTNKLRRRGNLSVRHVTEKAQMPPLLDVLIAQHRSRWAHTPTPSDFERTSNVEFYRKLLSSSDELQMCFSCLQIDNEIAACHLGFESGNDFLWYKSAYNSEFSAESPGEIMLSDLIRWCWKRGYARLDFTRGSEAYKLRFADHYCTNRNFIWYPSTTLYMRRKSEKVLKHLLGSLIGR